VFKYRLAEILLKLVLNTNHVINQLINQSKIVCCVFFWFICCCGKQSNISIESENTLLPDLNIFINKMNKRQVRIRCTYLIDSWCIMYFTSSERRTVQTPEKHLHPTMTATSVAICPPQPVDSLYERLYFTAQKLGSMYIRVFNQEFSYYQYYSFG
jgi:hypothetical protein